VSNLKPSAIEANVCLDELDADRLGRLQVGESVATTMRDQERARPASNRRRGHAHVG
jgi:hypothetical protein